MNDKILSQDEISALLGGGGDKKKKRKKPAADVSKGASSPESSTAAGASAEKIAESVAQQVAAQPGGAPIATSRNVFPILKPQGLGTDLENTLNVVLDSFAQNGVSTLAAALRAQVNLKVEGMDQLTYREFIQGLPEPSSIWSLRLNPMGLNIALCLESRLVHAMVDLLMGGEGIVPKIKRSITELDQSVMEAVVKVFCKEFQEAWSRIMKFEIEIQSRETRPGFLQIYPHGENMISIIMLMKAGETEGQVFWGIPGLMLLKFKNKMESQTHGRSGQSAHEAGEKIQRIMTAMPTSLNAVIQGTRISVSELMSMQVGDVIRLEQRIDSTVIVKVNNLDKFTGHVVLSQGRKAVQVVERMGRD